MWLACLQHQCCLCCECIRARDNIILLPARTHDQHVTLHTAGDSYYIPEEFVRQYNTSSSSFQLSNHSIQGRAPPDLVPPNLPHGPSFWGFEDQDQLNCIARAFTDAWQIILRARVILHDCNHPVEQNPTFLRYFRAQDADWVRKRFDWISGDDYQGPAVMAQQVQAPEGMVNALSVRYRFQSNNPTSPCDTRPNLVE